MSVLFAYNQPPIVRQLGESSISKGFSLYLFQTVDRTWIYHNTYTRPQAAVKIKGDIKLCQNDIKLCQHEIMPTIVCFLKPRG